VRAASIPPNAVQPHSALTLTLSRRERGHISLRRGLTLLELMLAIGITLMIVGAMGGLARTVEQGFEYSEGYGLATQHARVVLDRIAENVSQAAANNLFPGCLVVAETVGADRFPDTLVVWRPVGATTTPDRLPYFNELVIYCPNPTSPSQLLEITAPSDGRSVPAPADLATWQTEMAALKSDSTVKKTVLTTLLRTCTPQATTGNEETSSARGAVRFEVRLRPSADDWAGYSAGTVTWANLPWVQGIQGSYDGKHFTGLRQVWVRTELQLMPGVAWVSSNTVAARAVPYFGSAALYYTMSVTKP